MPTLWVPARQEMPAAAREANMQDSQSGTSVPADAEHEDRQRSFTPANTREGPSVVARASYDRAYRQRKRGIYVLAGVCVAFFVVVVSACYIAAAVYGYGTGFGDGKELPTRIPPLGGTGFW